MLGCMRAETGAGVLACDGRRCRSKAPGPRGKGPAPALGPALGPAAKTAPAASRGETDEAPGGGTGGVST